MDQATLALFVHEIRNQCIFTEAAFQVFNQSLQNRMPMGAFFAGQSILHSGSQIGSLLWPTRARSKARGETLRKALQLPDNHPLADRRLTTLWDTADERLEEWIHTTKGSQVIFDHLGTIPTIAGEAIAEEQIYRLYDPQDHVFIFRGNGYRLQAIADAISDIYKRVMVVHRELLPEQYREPAAATTPPPPPAVDIPEGEKTGELSDAGKAAGQKKKAPKKRKAGASAEPTNKKPAGRKPKKTAKPETSAAKPKTARSKTASSGKSAAPSPKSTARAGKKAPKRKAPAKKR